MKPYTKPDQALNPNRRSLVSTWTPINPKPTKILNLHGTEGLNPHPILTSYKDSDREVAIGFEGWGFRVLGFRGFRVSGASGFQDLGLGIWGVSGIEAPEHVPLRRL